ncbi:MAG: SAM-dependent methyltransferase [Clostridia bacterium]|nr:SAM-dependent methyltransferase [Clostridia bacterium]
MDMITYLKDIIDLSPFVGSVAVSGVRRNPLKVDAARFLPLLEGKADKAAYFEDGYRLLSEKEGMGNTPLHMAGGCYFQEPSAMSAVTAMDVKNGDKVLDLCAAPGSKATALAALNPDGITVANEIHPKRAQILVSNMERMGISSALITHSDAEGLERAFGSYFDKILVDAPCSGEGMFRKYPEILKDWTEELVTYCARRSREILEYAAAMLRPDGRLVYSTCTFNAEENEKNILDFLQSHPEFEVVDSGIKGAHSGLYGLEKAARIFPDQNGEGHFVCALHKRADAPENSVKISCFTDCKALPSLQEMLSSCVQMPLVFYGGQRQYVCRESGQNVYLIPSDLPNPQKVHILRAGVQAAQLKGKTYVPCHHLYTATPVERFTSILTVDDAAAGAFFRGETLPCDGRGFTAVVWNGLCLGFGKAVDGTLKNYYPKGLRI